MTASEFNQGYTGSRDKSVEVRDARGFSQRHGGFRYFDGRAWFSCRPSTFRARTAVPNKLACRGSRRCSRGSDVCVPGVAVGGGWSAIPAWIGPAGSLSAVLLLMAGAQRTKGTKRRPLFSAGLSSLERDNTVSLIDEQFGISGSRLGIQERMSGAVLARQSVQVSVVYPPVVSLQGLERRDSLSLDFAIQLSNSARLRGLNCQRQRWVYSSAVSCLEDPCSAVYLMPSRSYRYQAIG